MVAVNPARGEVGLVVDGVPRRLRLTLGALAALEASGGVASLPVPAATAESPSGGSLRGTDGAGATQPADAAADPLALDPATLSAEEA
ncbi:MAG: hypothetical protein AAFN05_15755, partial [Pseudomonadota bacterium]